MQQIQKTSNRQGYCCEGRSVCWFRANPNDRTTEDSPFGKPPAYTSSPRAKEAAGKRQTTTMDASSVAPKDPTDKQQGGATFTQHTNNGPSILGQWWPNPGRTQAEGWPKGKEMKWPWSLPRSVGQDAGIRKC